MLFTKKTLAMGILVLVSAGFSFAQVIDQTVARVRLTKPEVITQRQLRQQIELVESQTRQPLPPDNRRRMLDLQIGEILINQAAARDNFRASENELNENIARYKEQMAPDVSDAQFRTIVQNQIGLSWDEFTATMRKRLIQEKYIMEKKRSYFNDIKDPSDAELRQIYEANATDFTNPQIVRFNQVYIATRSLSDTEKQLARRRAEEALAELRSSQFKDVVLKYSDDTNTKYKGGDAGYFARNDARRQAVLGKNFFDALFAMNVNQVSGIIESNIGLHIIQVSEKREPKLLGFKDPVFPGAAVTVEERIKNTVRAQNQQITFQKALTDLIEELKKDAEITVYEQYLNW
ncbi:MAG: peptidylprolyl isomerase [Spirochaetales bacterium]|jgi:parvulin-like peptidyl-prolyl isomerase|nr:peptidylprolyl isomerase [Spirochaetales bacterium]